MNQELENRILASMGKHSVPGLSMTLIENGEISWSNCFGVSSSESCEAVTPDTVFEAASISKPVFAYAALGLYEGGAIELDAPLDGYLSEPFLEGDSRLPLITMRRVLCHTTGFQNWRGETPLEIHFEPGERFSYSGEGYMYLQKVIEDMTGLPLEVFMERSLLGPFGLEDSSYVWRDEYEGRMAYPHDEEGKVSELRRRPKAMSASSLYSTSEDLARFMLEILAPSNRDAHNLSPATVDEMLTPQVRVNDSISWGLGWGLQHTNDGVSFWQWGDNGGYKNFAMASKERGNGVVVLTNGANGLRLCEELIPVLMRGPQPVFGEFLNVMRDKGYII